MDNRIAAIIAKHLENLVLLSALKLVAEEPDAANTCEAIYDETAAQSALLKDIITSLNSAPPPTSDPETGADSPAGALSTPGGAPSTGTIDPFGNIRAAAKHPQGCDCDWCANETIDWNEGMGGDAILDRNVP